MSPIREVSLRVSLSDLESYIPGLIFPSRIEGNIYKTSVPQPLLFADIDLFLFESDDENSVLDIFPLFMFRTKEESLPKIGDIKEIRLLGLYGRSNDLSLNSYVKGNATIMEFQ
jgi:hypothetical protein